MSTNQAEDTSTDVNAVRGIVAYLAVSGVVFVSTLLLGLLSYAGETGYLLLPKPFIAQVASAQGVGMVLAALLGGSAVMWTFLRQQVVLSTPILLLNLLMYVVGLGMVFGAIFVGGPRAAELQLIGLLSVDIGFLMFFLMPGGGSGGATAVFVPPSAGGNYYLARTSSDRRRAWLPARRP